MLGICSTKSRLYTKRGVSMDVISKILTSLGLGDYALIVLFLGIFIDITPGIKLNPVKAIFKYLGKSFNSSVEAEVSELKEEVNTRFDAIQKEQKRQKTALDRIIIDSQDKEINRLRWEIIDFDNGIQNKVKHSKEQYRHILNSFSRYKVIMDDIGSTSDEYYHDVIQHGNTIKKHYEECSDLGEAFF